MMPRLFLACLALMVAACQPAPPPPEDAQASLQLRMTQSRVFDTADRNKTMRSVIATLQDLGYALDKVDPAAGTVTATKLSALRLTVSVYPRGSAQTVVRANAMVGNGQVDSPLFYQQLFFEPLAKAMFLDAHPFDGNDSPPPAPPPETPAKAGKKVKK